MDHGPTGIELFPPPTGHDEFNVVRAGENLGWADTWGCYMQSGAPVAFGVLTTDTIEQAIERAGTKAGNKGADAAIRNNFV